MSKKIVENTATKFRQHFSLPETSLRKNLYARHMYGSLKHMQAKMRLVDCVIEVHDARIPFTGRNSMFKQTLYGTDFKPHILVLNKMDLIEKEYYSRIERQLFASDRSLRNIIWTNCRRRRPTNFERLMDAIKERIIGLPRYNREYQTDYNLMVIGVPNVGKSSLINVMRGLFADLNNMATPVGPRPGVTKSVMTKIAIHENPKIYILDTPGILMPNVGDNETAMKLALCETVDESVVGAENIADYALYYLNKQQYFDYVEYCGLDEPTDSVYNMLYHLAFKDNLFFNTAHSTGVIERKANVLDAALKFVAAFRSGKLGSQFIDLETLNKSENR